MTTQLYRERQLWSGNESVEIRYVNGSFVAGTSASSPGLPRHIHLLLPTLTHYVYRSWPRCQGLALVELWLLNHHVQFLLAGQSLRQDTNWGEFIKKSCRISRYKGINRPGPSHSGTDNVIFFTFLTKSPLSILFFSPLSRGLFDVQFFCKVLYLWSMTVR